METNWMGLRQTLEKNKLILLLDTNFLIYMANGLIAPSMIDEALERSYTIATVRSVIYELENFASTRKPSISKPARTALIKILPSINIIILPFNQQADDALILAALQLKGDGIKTIIATGDKRLRSRARLHGIPTLYYRENKRKLELDWDIL